MGVAVSNWILAKATALRGQLGVVSGTGIDTVLVRRLQDGDAGGHMRRAMRSFPIPGVSDAVMAEHFRPAGREGGKTGTTNGYFSPRDFDILAGIDGKWA